MENLTEQQKQYLETLASYIKAIVKQHHISEKDFNKYFNQIVLKAHEGLQNGIKDILTDKEKLQKICDECFESMK